MFYERVFRELNKEGVKYLVIGGIALNLHGVPRATADLDLAVEIEKKMQAFTFWNPKKSFEEVDILIKSPIEFKDLDKAKKVVKAKYINIPIASIDHLIKLKETSGRKQDEADIEALKKIKKLG